MEDFNRIEFKYLLEEEIYEKFLAELQEYVTLDEYNVDGKAYDVYNIYYDSEKYYFIRSGLIRNDYKVKIRARSYEGFDENSIIFLEQKEKKDGIVYKQRYNITTNELYNNMISINNMELQPKCIITYERLAFIGSKDENLRITFDYKIFGIGIIETENDKNIELDKKFKITNKIILEIKTNNGLPNWLLQLLSKYRIKNCNFSKYGEWYKKSRKG